MFRTWVFLAWPLLLASAVGVARAQPPSGRVEAWGAFALAATRIDSTFTTSYVPVIERYSPPREGSTAGQTVAITGSRGAGFEAGLNVFFTEHLGAQVFLDRDGSDISGPAGDYRVLLNYTAMQPPDYVSRPYAFSRTFTACDASTAWGCVPATAGRLRQTTLALNLVGRWSASSSVHVEVSGGLGYFDLRGDAQPLRYTAFEMGGHSTLFSQEYQLACSLGPAHGVGVNAGGALDFAVGKGLSLVVDARYFAGGDVSAPIVVTNVVNESEIVFLQEPAAIQQQFHPPNVLLNPGRARLALGMRIRR